MARIPLLRRGFREVDAPDGWAHTADQVLTVTADDGVELHVEIDAPMPGGRPRRGV